MKITAKSKWLSVVLALALVLVLLPFGETRADEPEVEENFGFIPNAEEASVSKVDLLNFEEVARYSTVEPRPEETEWPVYRVSRLAMDSGGNAWALNTMTGSGWSGYNEAQGSVARINADEMENEEPGNTTSNSSAIVEEDARVSYFDLGEEGDGPRTINIVEEDGTVFLWIGFYLGNYFELYEYDEVEGTLEPVEGMKIDVDDYTPYTAALDDDGIMWVVSRNASPFPSPESPSPGVFRFDTNNLGAGTEALEYEVDGQNNPYSIMIDNNGNVWVSDAGDWGSSKDRQFAVYDSLTGDVDYVPVGFNVRPMRGFMQDEDGTIWATTVAGEVLKGTEDDGNWEFDIALGNLGELAGIGKDAQGYIWVVRYGNDSISRFDPADELPIEIDETETVGVGSGPYAYDNFIVEAPPVEKCYGDETAWAYSDEYAKPIWDYVQGNNWGWTNGPLSEGSYEFDIYAGAGRNDIEKGTLVGTLYVEYEDGTVTVTYELNEGYYLGETHLWVGDDVLPEVRRGNSTEYTNAPGQFPYGQYLGFGSLNPSGGETEWEWSGSDFEDEIYIAAHAVVWMEVGCEE